MVAQVLEWALSGHHSLGTVAEHGQHGLQSVVGQASTALKENLKSVDGFAEQDRRWTRFQGLFTLGNGLTVAVL